MIITETEKTAALETAWRCPAMERHGEFTDQCEEQGSVFDPATGLWFCAAHIDTEES